MNQSTESANLPLLELPRLNAWHELGLYAMILMELCWSVLWYRAIIPGGVHLPYLQVLWVISLMLLFPHFLARILNFLGLKVLLRRVIFLAVLLVNLLVGLQLFLYSQENIEIIDVLRRPVDSFRDMQQFVPIEFFTILLTFWITWRGISWARIQVEPDFVLDRFRWGIIMLFGYGVAGAYTGEIPMPSLYIFIFASLMALTASRIAILSHLRGGQRIHFDRQWFIGLGLSIGIMVGIAALAVSFFQQEFFTFFSMVAASIFYVISIALSPLLWSVMRLAYWFAEILDSGGLLEMLINFFRNLAATVDSIGITIREWIGDVDFSQLRDLAVRIEGAKQWILWGVVIIVGGLTLLAVRRYIGRESTGDEQDFQSLLDQENLLGVFRNALRRGVNRLFEQLAQAVRLGDARRLLAAVRIRRIYARLMKLSSRLGRIRPPARTPLEFLPELYRTFPGMENELDIITAAYNQVRYGELPETSEDVERVELAWRRVMRLGNERIHSKKSR